MAEQFPHFRRSAVHTFGMPLYTDGKGMGGHFHCFRGLVGSGGGDDQFFPDFVQGLVVLAVYVQDASYAFFQQGP